jgi:hypothetical protein
MSGKITMREIVPLYDTAKMLYHDQIQLEEAIRSLKNSYGINENSMKDYFNCFAAMMEGNVYKRTINNEATDYYLRNILIQYGASQLEKALESTRKHVEYYRNQQKGNLKGVQALIEKHHQRAI